MDRVKHLPAHETLPPTTVASTLQEQLEAYQLVYQIHLASRFILPNKAKLLYQRRFGLHSTRTLFTSLQRRVVGTLTVVGDNPLGLHLEATFPCEVEKLRDAGRRIAEVSCLAIHRTRIQPLGCVFFSLTRFMFQYSDWRGYDNLLLAVHPRHVPFYTQCFNVQQLGPCRPHSLVLGHPAVACCIDICRLKERVDPGIIDWYTRPPIPAEKFMRPAMSRHDHDFFCNLAGIPQGQLMASMDAKKAA